MSQIHRTASAIANLQITLDVYEGLFARKEDAAVILKDFRQIGGAIKKSLSTEIIVGCAALFSDPAQSFGNKNMSLDNLVSKYEATFSDETKKVKSEISALVEGMNLKTFRNKHIGHFGLPEMLGETTIERDITVMNVRELLEKAQTFINMIMHDSGSMPADESLAFYRRIPKDCSPGAFLRR